MLLFHQRASEPQCQGLFTFWSKSVSDQPIGKCFVCDAPIYAGELRRGIWRYVLPPRIVRTCACFDVMLSTIQYCLVNGVHMPGAMAMMPVREESE